MSRSIGEYLSRRLSVLREWKNLAERVARIIKELIPNAEVYVFGSIVAGRITGSSDLDILIVIPNDLCERDIHTYLSIKLEEALNSTSYIVDLHVVRRENLNKPPYTWWIKRALRID